MSSAGGEDTRKKGGNMYRFYASLDGDSIRLADAVTNESDRAR